MNRLEKSIASLLDNYETYGMVNHSGEGNLPGRESIDSIVRGLEELLFPGFLEIVSTDKESLHIITNEKVINLAKELNCEVEKSLAFSARLGVLNCGNKGCRAAAAFIVEEFFEELSNIRIILAKDLEAAVKGDPAAMSADEVILSYPGFQAITIQRIAHFFWTRQVPLIPRMMSELLHRRTGIDIHPGAVIGESFFIDHGTGVVIGETTIIGKNVKIYQGVTLGALSVKKDESGQKRHPTIEDDVTIYANATILGGQTVIGKGSIIGGSVWITKSVPPGSRFYLKRD
ncbi:MAG: serine acetyltransferase [Treponema sp.]|nr:serine acetyltransferase [Treponema sp.]MCL2252672.1 serine acetyltransferase [Treponema sp.]